MTDLRATGDPDVVDDPDQDRYEIRFETEVAGFAEYTRTKGQITFTHTEVRDAFASRRLGSQLARADLDDVRARGLVVIPLCPFIAGWIRQHPAYVDLVDERHRRAVEPRP